MRTRRGASQTRTVVTRAFVLSVSALTLFGTCVGSTLAAAPVAGAATIGSHLTISGPARAPLGRNVSFQLVGTAPRTIGAFQANLRYDGQAVEVVRIRTAATLPGAGGLTSLSADETPNRKVIAGWTCSGPGCATSTAAAPGAPVVLATVDVEALRPGPIELRVDGALLTDPHGTAIGTVSARTTFVAGTGGSAHDAPGTLSYAVAAPAPHAARLPLDVNRDGHVSQLDVSALSGDFVRAVEGGASCPTAPRGDDVNGDGCLTVADLQTVASGITASAAPAPTPYALHGAATVSYTVNSTGDGTDAANDGVCQTSTAGECTLRAALVEANRQSVPVSIAFNIPGTGVHTIAPATRLPALNNPSGITIDGFTQPGSSPNTDDVADNAVYGIELVGTGPSGIDGFFVTQANNVIRGLDMHNFDRSIWVYGQNATNNLVEGDMLGLTPTGDMDPNWTLQSASSCVVLQQGAANNQVGAPGDANRNVISGCNHQDIATYDWPTKYTTIQNNIAGLDPTGTQRRPAKSHGIDINTGTQYTMIGGTDPGDRNVSSGNMQEGVEISHNSLTQHNSIIGNYIGTDLTGNNAFSYTQNGQWGVHLEGDPTCNNQPCNLDMGFATVTNNVIVNAQRGGLLVDKGVHDSTIANNLIGLTANGTPAPNLLFGVNIQAGSVRNTLGPGNTIADNANGVQMESDGLEPPNSASSLTNQNTITQNSIYANGSNGTVALGIDLAPFGQVNTAANCDSNVNDCMLPPVLSNATTTSLTATTCASCVVELFVADQPTGSSGSGQTYIESATANGSGIATFAIPANIDGAVVTATATSTAGSTSEFAKNVQIPGTSTNNAPTALFTYSCSGLACSFDGSTSTDSDGQIINYNWSFGDGTSATGSIVQHSFAAVNTYGVKLTVTDNGGATGSTTQSVAVSDLPPAAAFTGSCSQLSCNFDGSSSSDPDNSISSYTWDFGDASPTGSGVTTSHTYAVGGQYTVTLTVDDGQGGTNSVAHTFNVTVPTVVAQDAFNRSVASGWASADIGGAYAAATGVSSGSTSVNGTAGSITLTSASGGRGFALPSVSVLNSDSLVDVSTNLLPAGGTFGQASYITARHVSANTEYRLRLRLLPNGTVHLSFVKTVGNTTEVAIGSDVAVPGLTDAANTVFRVRFDVTGTNPTTLQAKVWLPGSSEPVSWEDVATDGEAALQTPGAPGLRAYLGASATNAPTWQFDNFTVLDLNGNGNTPPNASFTGSCTQLACSFDGTASSDPGGSVAAYSWNFGDGSPAASGATANYSYGASGSYTVTLTVTDNLGATNSVSHVFKVSNATVVAQDTFGRTVSSGWGSADLGGAYAAASGTTSGSSAVGFGAGVINLTATPSGKGFYLPSVSGLNTDSLVDVSTSAAPAGGTFGQVAYITARRVNASTEYRVRLRFVPGGAVKLSFVKTVGSATEVAIGKEITLSGVTDAANTVFRLRFDVTGSSPTTLQAKAWLAGAAEPASWQLAATDSEAALQSAGNPGLRAYLGGSATNKPSWAFDNFTVTAL